MPFGKGLPGPELDLLPYKTIGLTKIGSSKMIGIRVAKDLFVQRPRMGRKSRCSYTVADRCDHFFRGPELFHISFHNRYTPLLMPLKAAV